MILPKFKEDFIKRYAGDEKTVRYFSAPLSLTLSGSLGAEYGGNVLLLPISMKVTCGIRRRKDSAVNIEYSDSDLQLSSPKASFNMINTMQEAALGKKFYERCQIKIGADMLFHHDARPLSIPFPDRAATSMCMITALSKTFDLSINDIEQIRLCESIENTPTHLGAVCKLCAVHAEKNAVFAADCKTLSYQNYTWLSEPYRLVILHTKNPPAYSPKIKRDIDTGLRIMKERNPELSDVCNLTLEQVRDSGHRLSGLQKRLLTEMAEEQQRIKSCKKALENNDIPLFCNFLNGRGSVSDSDRELLYKLPEISGIYACFITDDNDIVCFVRDEFVDIAMNEIFQHLQEKRIFLVADTGAGVCEYQQPSAQSS